MLEYPIGVSKQTLVVTDPVLSHFASHRQKRWFQKEAGGQLFAKITENRVIILEATGPRRTDRRSRFSYAPDREAEQEEILARRKDGLHFVGDWHTHPEQIPRPSYLDSSSMNECVRKSYHSLNGFVLIVVGKEDPPLGLHVSLCDGQTSHILFPSGNSRGSPHD